MNPESFQLQLRSLLASLAVHVEAWTLEEPRELLNAGEWGLSFEAVCDGLYEVDEGVFPGEVCEIESLGEQLRSERRAWRLMHELQIDPGPPRDAGHSLMTSIEMHALTASILTRESGSVLTEVEQQIDADLPGSFRALCTALSSGGTAVFPGERCALESLGSQLGVDESAWSGLPNRRLDD